MALRLPCLPITLNQGGVLFSRWGNRGFFRPMLDLYAIGEVGSVQRVKATIDTACDYVALQWGHAGRVVASPSRLRHQPASGAGGHALPLFFSSPGQVALFVTDFYEYCYLANPLVGFHSHSTPIHSQRSVLGLTGFLEYFRFTLDHAPARPTFELEPLPLAGVQTGTLPKDRPLADFIRQLHATS